jgi:RNase P subunit RPR2
MADNLGPMAWLFLPENEQVQYLQKIAQKIHSARKQYSGYALSRSTRRIFCTKCNFLLPLGQHIFRQQRQGY